MSRLVMLSSFVCSQLRFLLGLIASLSFLFSSFLGKLKVRVNGPLTAKDAPPLTNSDSVLTEDSVRVRFITPQPFGEVLRLEGGEGPTHFFEFRRSLEDAWFDRGWSEEAKVRCIWRHLGPDPREELDCQTNGRPTTPDDAFRLLDRRFGDNRDPCQVFVELFNLSQSLGETITSYSHHLHRCYRALLRLEEKRGDPHTICPDYHLRSMFIRGIASLELRRVLRHLLKRDTDTTFDQLRDEALSWEKSEVTVINQGVELTLSTPETPAIVPCQLDQLEATAPASLIPARSRPRRRRRTLATTQLVHPAVRRMRQRRQRTSIPEQTPGIVRTFNRSFAQRATLMEIRALCLMHSPEHRDIPLAASTPAAAPQVTLPAAIIPAGEPVVNVPLVTSTPTAVPQVPLPAATIPAGDDLSGRNMHPQKPTPEETDQLLADIEEALADLSAQKAQQLADTQRMVREATMRKNAYIADDQPPPYEALVNCRPVPAPRTRIVA